MKINRMALIGVFVAAGAVIAYKEFRNIPAQSTVQTSGEARVVLVADLSEAEDRCACGEIIRAVRATQKKRIPTQELSPDRRSELLNRYRVLTVPTVLILDTDGKEIARYEGEDEKTVEAIQAGLKQLIEGSRR